MSFPVYILRHGQTAWNIEARFQGQVDTEITELGQQQADGNGRLLASLIGDAAGFDFVASPMHRTRETMERVRAAMGLPRDGYRTDARLIEVHFGDWQGWTIEEIEAREPGSTARRALDKWNFLPPGRDAESYEMLLQRVKPWLDELSRPTVCVIHGGVVRALFRLVEGVSQADAADLDIPQDRILRLEGGRLKWLQDAGATERLPDP